MLGRHPGRVPSGIGSGGHGTRRSVWAKGKAILLNLGSTRFYDGSPVPGAPGWYVEQYLTYSRANRFNDANGDKLNLPKQQLEVFAPTTQIIYVPEAMSNDMTLGATALVTSLVHADVDDGLHNAALSSRNGVGEVVCQRALHVFVERYQP